VKGGLARHPMGGAGTDNTKADKGWVVGARAPAVANPEGQNRIGGKWRARPHWRRVKKALWDGD
jgi:hypothetical protein